jgi:hypothetical protein
LLIALPPSLYNYKESNMTAWILWVALITSTGGIDQKPYGTYPTETLCENAKKDLLAQWAAETGGTVTLHSKVTCNRTYSLSH